MNLSAPSSRTAPGRRGCTLLEFLVMSGILLALGGVVYVGSVRFMENSRKAKALSLLRDFQVGMSLFEADYRKPPIPRTKRDSGWDTVYGDPGGNYTNQFLVSALAGEDKDYPYKGESFSTKDVNPRNQRYMTFPAAVDKKGGVGDDGKLYDPWGGEVMVAINGFKSTGTDSVLTEFNHGQNDRRLHTWGLAEYTETSPGNESYVCWSYGKDGKKGNHAANKSDVVPLKGSDDVISW